VSGIFCIGDRVVTRAGRRATVRPTPNDMLDMLGPIPKLIFIRLDTGETCFLEESWLEHLNPTDWLGEIA